MASTNPDQPKRIQRKRSKGWKMPLGAVYVGRPTAWGNPFRAQAGVIDAETAVLAYRALLTLDYGWFRRHGFGWTAGAWMSNFPKGRRRAIQEFIAPLRGKDLACWCPLVDKDGNRVPCHADVLLELANQ